jgi:hypothetical protein
LNGLLYTMQLLGSQRADASARNSAAVAHAENARQFRKRKAKRERAAYRAYTIHTLRRVKPVPIRGAHRSGQNANPLIMSQQIRADAQQSGQLARTKKLLFHESQLERGEYQPWNAFQGQAPI